MGVAFIFPSFCLAYLLILQRAAVHCKERDFLVLGFFLRFRKILFWLNKGNLIFDAASHDLFIYCESSTTHCSSSKA